MARFSQVDVFQSVPARLGEGVCWHAARQAIWWVDILGRRIYEAALTDKLPRTLECAQMVGALAPTRKGGIVAALHGGIHLLDPQSGAARLFARPADHDERVFRFNDAKVDPMGRL